MQSLCMKNHYSSEKCMLFNQTHEQQSIMNNQLKGFNFKLTLLKNPTILN